ncbi:translation elongation factor EF-G [Bacillus ectoiniformans]|uniref:hypothetical protein n=1 Tax=Bacillus ectoiniformans TaxID=1494429 RepID=UPI00195BFA9C|nr:hypothetical protein [Bacillus ectoiniformans]MBM7649365.1 translation elongation factor EF-G [Bacillus ectoiniformans]
MDTQLFELKNSLKQLVQNLIVRIHNVTIDLENNNNEKLLYWLEDLSMLTEAIMVLSKNNIIELELDVFNEKAELLLDKVEEKDYLFVKDLLQYEINPLLQYLDGCLTND